METDSPEDTLPEAADDAQARHGFSRRSLLLTGGLAGVGALAVGAGAGIAIGHSHARTAPASPSAAKAPSPLMHFQSTSLTTPRVESWKIGETEPGLLFVTQQTGTFGGKGFRGMIMDDRGEPVWIEPTGANITDLRMQTYNGKTVLTYWEGTSIGGHGQGAGHILDTSYQHVTTVHAGNGLDADLHEFHLTPQGTALVTAYETIPADLSVIGGPKSGYIYNCHAQEIDISTGKVLLDWNVNEHVPVSDTYLGLKQDKGHDGTTAARAFDAYHINAIDDWGDMLLVSLRHTHTVYAIGRTSGVISWRLGGKNSDFTIQPDAAFAWQHDARHHPDGTITIFDNHLYSGTDGQSAGKQFRLDTTTHAATLITDRTFNRHLGTAMGSVKPFDSGHVLVGWGVAPFVTEFDKEGTAVYQAMLGAMSYRAYRHPWKATPATKPAVAAATKDGATAVHMSWNGATEVASWRVLAASGSGALNEVAIVPRSRFETLARIAPATSVAVQALDANGKTLGTSRTIKA